MKSHSLSNDHLRRIIRWDVALTAPAALAMAIFAGPLGALTQLPETLLRVVGIALLPYVAWLLWLARRPSPSRTASWTMVGLNAVYAVECVVLPALGWVAPSLMGWGFLLAQAVVVGTLALLGARALRAPRPQAQFG